MPFKLPVPRKAFSPTAVTVAGTSTSSTAALSKNIYAIESLVVKGALNAADIAYLRNGIGKLIKTEALDISEVTLVPGSENVTHPNPDPSNVLAGILSTASGSAFELTPWADNLTAENGVVYIGSIAYKYDAETDTGLPTFSFKEGTNSLQ